jgi:hypothetical protein
MREQRSVEPDLPASDDDKYAGADKGRYPERGNQNVEQKPINRRSPLCPVEQQLP